MRPPRPLLARVLRARIVRVALGTVLGACLALLGAREVSAAPGAQKLAARMRDEGLSPRHALRVGKVDYLFTDLFELGPGRPAALAEVRTRSPKGASPFFRLFYRSKSQGVFRLLPALNLAQRRYGGDFDGLPGFDKGPGEEHLTAPLPVQDLLSALAVRPPRALDGLSLAEQAVPVYRSPTSYQKYQRSTARPQRHALALEETRDGVARIRPGLEPDYRHPLSTGRTRTELGGEVEQLRYPSTDGRVVYTLHVDATGHAQIASVTAASVGANRYGLPSISVALGEVGMPRWEYPFQIPRGQVGVAHPSDADYASSWAALRSRPEIRAFYRVTGRRMPAASE